MNKNKYQNRFAEDIYKDFGLRSTNLLNLSILVKDVKYHAFLNNWEGNFNNSLINKLYRYI